MFLSMLCILLLTTSLEAANTSNNRAIMSSTQRKLSNTQYEPKEHQIIASNAMKSEFAKANDVIIQHEHNLLGVAMAIVTRLMEIKSSTLSDLCWEILSRFFAAAISVIFGPNTNILWPDLAHIAVPFSKLLTT